MVVSRQLSAAACPAGGGEGPRDDTPHHDRGAAPFAARLRGAQPVGQGPA
jgi:hypothetical protein